MDYPNFKLIALLIAMLISGKVDRVLAADSAEARTSLETLTEETCSKKRNGCCSELSIAEHPNFVKCVVMYSSKMEGVDDKSPEALIKVFSCLVECFYKKNKYIGKGDTLNMKMVKMDAEHQFAERPKEKAYYIKAYDECNKRVTKEFGAIKNSPAVKALFKTACRPFFTLIFLCHSDYHTKNSCPYFRWEDADNEEHCKDAREKCYEIDGLEVPERIFD